MTTDEMDGWEEGKRDYSTWYQCMECGHWTLFKDGVATRCEDCDSSRMNPQSATSDRTFNVERAAKKEKLVKKEIEKRNRGNR